MRFTVYSNDWFLEKLDNVCQFVRDGTHGSFKDVEIGIPLLSAKDIFDGKININENSRLISIDDYNTIHKNYELTKGDILLTIVGTIGRTAMVNMDEKFTLQRSVAILRVNEQISYNFLYYYIQTSAFQNRLKSVVNQSAQGGVYLNSLKKLNIKLTADMNEQNKISSFLSIIDKKIKLLEQKYQYYQEFKKYLMQKIFAQELRFNFNDAWKTVKIKDIFDERSEKGFLDLELLSVTLNDGVIKRSEIESKDNSNENKSNYKHVLPGDIVYNSMRMWQGASGVSPYEGIVSPAYTILIPKNVYSKYFGYYFKTNEMVYQFKKYSQGLTSDTWNLKYPLISEIKIKIPSIEEQKEITNVFEIMDEKIKILQNNIDELTTFKKGLLQQMFVVRINWRCNFKLAKSPSFNKHLLILKNKIIFIIIK